MQSVSAVVLLAEGFGLTRRARGMSIGLLSIATVLLMIDINSWYACFPVLLYSAPHI